LEREQAVDRGAACRLPALVPGQMIEIMGRMPLFRATGAAAPVRALSAMRAILWMDAHGLWWQLTSAQALGDPRR
jgi:hypothetical protein